MRDVEDLGSAIVVKVQDTKNYKSQSFTILGKGKEKQISEFMCDFFFVIRLKIINSILYNERITMVIIHEVNNNHYTRVVYILYFIHDFCHFHFLYPFLVRFFNTKYQNIEKSTHTNNNVDRLESNLFCFKSYFDL
jgi:hypothetical protein